MGVRRGLGLPWGLLAFTGSLGQNLLSLLLFKFLLYKFIFKFKSVLYLFRLLFKPLFNLFILLILSLVTFKLYIT